MSHVSVESPVAPVIMAIIALAALFIGFSWSDWFPKKNADGVACEKTSVNLTSSRWNCPMTREEANIWNNKPIEDSELASLIEEANAFPNDPAVQAKRQQITADNTIYNYEGEELKAVLAQADLRVKQVNYQQMIQQLK